MQVTHLHNAYDRLQKIHGDKTLCPIYGAGCTKGPRVMFVFMNPTGKNVSAHRTWKGLRAPWLGTKNVWRIFSELRLLSSSTYTRILDMKLTDWTEEFSQSVYQELKRQKIFVTNLAKCTQQDARPLKNKVFREYRELMLEEIASVKPRSIVTFGNQVSSILLDKPISVSACQEKQFETLSIKERVYKVYPVYYPVGQGQRNLPLAVARLRRVIGK